MERRFFIDKTDIQDNLVLLKASEHQHLSKVLRLKVGDEVECFYDNSDILICKIQTISKDSSILNIIGTKKINSNPQYNVTLFQALPKLDKLELITQKITELGLTSLIPFSSAFCIAKPNDNKNERLKKIIISACKQCGRTKLLDVKPSVAFKQMLQMLQSFDLIIFANETENATTLKQVFNGVSNKKLNNIAIIVGSEGGFSSEEITALLNLPNLKSITLGARILRTETASITLASLVQYELNEI